MDVGRSTQEWAALLEAAQIKRAWQQEDHSPVLSAFPHAADIRTSISRLSGNSLGLGARLGLLMPQTHGLWPLSCETVAVEPLPLLSVPYAKLNSFLFTLPVLRLPRPRLMQGGKVCSFYSARDAQHRIKPPNKAAVLLFAHKRSESSRSDQLVFVKVT